MTVYKYKLPMEWCKCVANTCLKLFNTPLKRSKVLY